MTADSSGWFASPSFSGEAINNDHLAFIIKYIGHIQRWPMYHKAYTSYDDVAKMLGIISQALAQTLGRASTTLV